jgi:hypothetical protein
MCMNQGSLTLVVRQIWPSVNCGEFVTKHVFVSVFHRLRVEMLRSCLDLDYDLDSRLKGEAVERRQEDRHCLHECIFVVLRFMHSRRADFGISRHAKVRAKVRSRGAGIAMVLHV